jgi:hypothetical protein
LIRSKQHEQDAKKQQRAKEETGDDAAGKEGDEEIKEKPEEGKARDFLTRRSSLHLDRACNAMPGEANRIKSNFVRCHRTGTGMTTINGGHPDANE